MSSEIYILVRNQDTFTSIWWSGRSSVMYQKLKGRAPYEKVRQLTKQDIEAAIAEVKRDIEFYKERIAENRKTMNEVGIWNNSISEKMSVLDELREAINEEQEEMDETIAAQYYLEFIAQIDEPIYVGIDCGDEITPDDVESEE